MRQVFALLLLAFWQPSAVYGDEVAAAAAALRSVVQERLSVMPEVARYKWNNKIAVEDLAREKAILKRTVEKAKKASVSEEFALEAVAAQMAASKHIQRELIRGWQAQDIPPFESVPDLVEEIRPQIIDITNRLIEAMRGAEGHARKCAFQQMLTKAPEGAINQEAWKIAINGFKPEGRCED